VNEIGNDAAFLIFVEKFKRVATFMLGNKILHVIIMDAFSPIPFPQQLDQQVAVKISMTDVKISPAFWS